MRPLALLLLGVLCVGLAPIVGWTQPPGMMGGPPGMMGGPPGMSGFSSRSSGSSGRSMFGDPMAMFDRLANGKSTITRNDLDSRGQWFWDNILVARMGHTGAELTREQFSNYTQNAMSRMGRGGDASSSGGSELADREFQRRDRNRDGLLSVDEMSDTLKAERDKWDANKDGFIDATEYKAYVTAFLAQRQSERGEAGSSLAPGESLLPTPQATPAEDDEARPTVFRAGKLPKELPAWFAQCDTDTDAQVGLYEWRAARRSLEEFENFDRNGDGFITVEEVLYAEKLAGKGSPKSGPSSGGQFVSSRGADSSGRGGDERSSRMRVMPRPGGDDRNERSKTPRPESKETKGMPSSSERGASERTPSRGSDDRSKSMRPSKGG